MHLLATSSTTLDEIAEPVDLRQAPGDILVLSFADSDLAGLAAAWAIERDVLPSVRLAHLRDLRHPMSVDLWIDRIGLQAKVILVRLLGGMDWWRYGVERIAAVARERGIALAILPGEDRDDARLADASTLPRAELDTLLRFFREGGRENLRALLRRLARHAGAPLDAAEPRPVPARRRLSAGRGRGRSRPACRRPCAGPGGRSDHLLPRACARGGHRAGRRAVRCPERARSQPRAADRHQPEGRGLRGLRARRAGAARPGGDRDDHRVRRRRRTWNIRPRSTDPTCRCCRS